MKKVGILFMTMLLCSGVLFAQVARPNALWFNKVITPERSRQLYVALNANMWVNYDLPFGVLTQAWNGGTTGGAFISGAPYSSMGGATGQYWFLSSAPQFPHVWRSSGTNYFRDSNQVAEYFASYTPAANINTTNYYQPGGKWPQRPISTKWGGTYKSWTVLNGATDAGATYRYRGFTVPGNVMTLKYSLILPNNSEITVSENPEFSNQPSGNHLIRTFTFAGIPAGYSVRLEHLGGSNASAWSVTSGSATIQSGALVQTANGQTVVNGSF
ncbi:MAG TPA: hypothetical protein DCQ83_06215 [Fibrobacteres bacterium]|jgi:hypothetical protein|nr:hypothetical protein [Fibrobacterota bacterium]